ncbi:MAG: alpha/beta fold hydrolase, partial [Planctomycetaceae bacterium]
PGLFLKKGPAMRSTGVRCILGIGLLTVSIGASAEGPVTQSREQTLKNFERVAGPFPQPESPVPLDVKVLGEERLENGVVRRKIAYHTDSNDATISAYLLLPDMTPGEKRPAVLVCHSTQAAGKLQPAGLADVPDKHIALHLAKRGYVAIAPDYPSFGEAKDYDFTADNYQSGAMKAIYDNIRSVDLLCSLPEVDDDRIGAIGHSLGGHTVIFAAVYDERIDAVVSNCGFTRFHRYYGGDLTGWTSERYFPRIASEFDKNPDKMPFDFPDLIAALAPRAFLASSPLHDDNFDVRGVKETIAAARPAYERLGAADKLRANYPDCEHAFPDDVRKVAYEFLDEQLGHVAREK